MFSHIMVGANDIEKSKLFYDKVLGVLGADEGRLFPNLTGQKRYFYFLDGMTFCISEPINNMPATSANGSTIGFNIIDESMGDEWHKAGIENGGESIEDPPPKAIIDSTFLFECFCSSFSISLMPGFDLIESIH